MRKGFVRVAVMGLTGVAAVAGSAGEEASAAVRACHQPVAAEAFGPNEREARKRALSVWKEKAGQFGPRFDGWRIATDRQINCATVQGLVFCRATARPCTIEQVPKKTVPKRGPLLEV